ncbi:AimR family lysis-lysogeny pheromone receptor [Bacillus cereus group sp. BfR-BA-02147]|uniref:AimR family lysis-lysogeny pheromone receptor n=1 Tax=Bacillus cereus group sp. BfR-BA-02147 TaxID=3094887 RepID=UPI0029C479AD|nr:AimR family lysis-lysogeny pheromone receptor [Bacillus cereus group sp. BfR-BA-02147]MDX5828899.1 AimR family lysis-lysogeny pheromone receptor [Bacillus cereus group sp. BfR-BA-02147]
MNLKQNENVESEKTLGKFLCNLIDTIDFQRRSQGALAKEMGVAGGTLSKNLTGKTQFGFWTLVKLLDILYDDINKRQEMLYTFCSVTTSKINLRIAMEYANAKGDLGLLKLIVDSEKKSKLAMNREWAFAYELVWMRSSGILQGKALLDELEERKKRKIIKTEEVKVLYGILTFYTMYDLEKFNALFDYAEVMKPNIELITDEFIRAAYSGRIKEGLSYAYLMQDKVDKARELCHEILNLEDDKECFALLRASALGYLAESYTFESYDRASWYVNKALETLDSCHVERAKKRRKNIFNTYAFIKLVNKQGLDNIKIYNVCEEAFYQVLIGKSDVAIKLLKECEIKDGKLSPMKKCILGYALKDTKLIEESIVDFECEGNRFYSKFPKKMLVKFTKNGTMCEGGVI